MEDVDVLADILADFPWGETSGGKKEEEKKARADLWKCVTSHVRTKEKLKRIVWDGATDWQEEEEEEVDEGEESGLEEEENMSLNESDDDILLHAFEDDESEEAEEDLGRRVGMGPPSGGPQSEREGGPPGDPR
jgi:hypothetical protein